MSGLYTSLTLAARALDAQRMGLDVAGHNVANVNTPGYARRVLDLSSLPASTIFDAGGGVRIDGVRAVRDGFLERRIEQEVPGEQREAARADVLSVVEATLGQAASAIDVRLTEFFGAFTNLADHPTSSVARQDVLSQADRLVSSFQNVAARIASAQREADLRVRGGVEEINALAQRIVDINLAYSAAGPSQMSLHLADEQGVALRRLAELIDIDVLPRENGGVDITIGNGRALVVGQFVYAVDVTPEAGTGFARLTTGGRDITDEIVGGQVVGYADVRDRTLTEYATRVDEAAFALANEVNAQHALGFDLAGVPGGDFFVAPAAVAGAARTLTLDPAVAADGSLVAAAAVAQAGDNGAAQAIARLRDARLLDGGTTTLVEGWSRLLYRIGADAQQANDARDSQAEIVKQVDALRDAISGVSLDEEAVQLMKFQRAYEANARYFSIVDQTISILFETFAR